MITIGKISKKDNFRVEESATINQAVDMMDKNAKGMVVATKKSEVVGILTERDLVGLLDAGIDFSNLISSVITKGIITVNESRSLNYSLSVMINSNIRRLVVVDNSGEFIGIVTQDMVIKYLEDDIYKVNLKVCEISNVSKRDIISLKQSDTIKDAMSIMQDNSIGSIIIMEEDEVKGIITERDTVKIAYNRMNMQTTLKEIMTYPVISVRMDEKVYDVSALMNKKNIRRVLIVDSDDTPVRVLGIRDIVKYIKGNYNDFLEKKLKYTKGAFDFIGEAVIEIYNDKENYVIQWINESAIKLFSKKILDTTIDSLIEVSEWKNINMLLKKNSFIKDYKISINDMVFELNSSYYYIKSSPIIILILKDITDYENRIVQEQNRTKQREEYLLHQSRFTLMGEMISNIAHQWRQPLASINAITAAIDISYETDSLTQEFLYTKLDEIENQTKYLSNTIENFRNFFHPDKNKELFSISQSLEKALEIVKSPLQNHNIDYSIEIIENSKIDGFPKEYMQILMIIVNNTIDAYRNLETQKRKIEFTIDRKNEKSILTIKDYAQGVPKEIENRIFDPYFTTKHQSKGTGLGLYMAKMIIEKSIGGELLFENSQEGAKFKIIV